jgi:hypothetical protein
MSDGAAQHDEDLKSRIAVLEAEPASVRRAHDQQAQMRERAEHEREQYRKLYSLVLFELERHPTAARDSAAARCCASARSLR